MKKVMSFVLVLCLVFALSSCSINTSSSNDSIIISSQPAISDGASSNLSTSTTTNTSTTCSDISSTSSPDSHFLAKKPAIYLYPTKPTNINVQLAFDGTLEFTYPSYNNGWKVTAYPDGKIINHADGKEYSYLFWEGHSNKPYDLSKGFVVNGADTVGFLQEKLSYMGLTPKEYNEFIVFWLPQMQNNAYNLISFQGTAYTDTAKLSISPKPDSMLRVFMVVKPLSKPVDIPEQKLSQFYRSGFSVVEWGGALIK